MNGCAALHSLRLAATSGRSCSAARSAFFKRQPEPPGRVPYRAAADLDAVLSLQPSLGLRQRDAGPRADVRRQRKLLHRRELARWTAAVRVYPAISRLPATDQRLVDVGDAHFERRRYLTDGHPIIHRRKHSIAQILRVTLP